MSNRTEFWDAYDHREKCCEVMYVIELEQWVARLSNDVEDVHRGYKKLRAAIHDFFENVNEPS